MSQNELPTLQHLQAVRLAIELGILIRNHLSARVLTPTHLLVSLRTNSSTRQSVMLPAA